MNTMKIGLAVGREFPGRGEALYESMKNSGFKPDFILFCFPEASRVLAYKNMSLFVRIPLAMVLKVCPIPVLRVLLSRYTPKSETRTLYSRGFNSLRTIRILTSENADAIVAFGCGMIDKRLCDIFHNVLLGAHAGKLPEYRGMNNVEWAYLEDADLYGTIQCVAEKMDTGDIACEKIINKIERPESIDQIREDAFDQVFSLFPKALEALGNDGFLPKKQDKARTARYRMHPFLKRVLESRFTKTEG